MLYLHSAPVAAQLFAPPFCNLFAVTVAVTIVNLYSLDWLFATDHRGLVYLSEPSAVFINFMKIA